MEKIMLNPVEAAAFYWVKIIRNKVKEIAITGANNSSEKNFAIALYYFTEHDYRELYLELIKILEDSIKSYVPKYKDDIFSQDTELGGHPIINKAIKKVLNKKICDIRLSQDSSKDSIIYVDNSRASVWYKSAGEMPLSKSYEPSYIITGDEESLNFYNLIISVVAVLHDLDYSFNSVTLLRDTFCSEYKQVNGLEIELGLLKEQFNYWFNVASDRDIIIGSAFKSIYFCGFSDIDFVGLDNYMPMAECYAKTILERARQK